MKEIRNGNLNAMSCNKSKWGQIRYDGYIWICYCGYPLPNGWFIVLECVKGVAIQGAIGRDTTIQYSSVKSCPHFAQIDTPFHLQYKKAFENRYWFKIIEKTNVCQIFFRYLISIKVYGFRISRLNWTPQVWHLFLQIFRNPHLSIAHFIGVNSNFISQQYDNLENDFHIHPICADWLTRALSYTRKWTNQTEKVVYEPCKSQPIADCPASTYKHDFVCLNLTSDPAPALKPASLRAFSTDIMPHLATRRVIYWKRARDGFTSFNWEPIESKIFVQVHVDYSVLFLQADYVQHHLFEDAPSTNCIAK